MVRAEKGEEVEVREALELPGWLERLVVWVRQVLFRLFLGGDGLMPAFLKYQEAHNPKTPAFPVTNY